MPDQKIIATAGLVSVGVGTANSIYKFKRPPSLRFLVGSGIAFLILSAMAQGEATAELAKGLALGIMTTVILGDGGGLASYFISDQEGDTKRARPLNPKPRKPPRLWVHAQNPHGSYRGDAVPAFPGIPPAHMRTF